MKYDNPEMPLPEKLSAIICANITIRDGFPYFPCGSVFDLFFSFVQIIPRITSGLSRKKLGLTIIICIEMRALILFSVEGVFSPHY
jgi:hypothetical protein